ncbi:MULTISPECIES: helix-turn-helix domain-containing protein [unclassified Paenibacillus]|uniref:helix-turn-helix domain-containing protein n=1 Tax=unclassified Paenibacillus TaxID=185978 RepID=UPI00020D7897|nr:MULTISPECIES: helix-turn-helix domain-containing protein [unclassified Paenibacillus]EGL18637.1 DNA-binding helix-turn-helix protein [Paenibacillus sp. HGF7]EPD80501.1 hypothetical protein HMPREF1207_05607 [Paenibacillus sp. HGH0039]
MADKFLPSRLKEVRKQRKKTQQDVADHLGIQRSSYSQYELGNREPDLDNLKRIADYLKTTTDYLLGREEVQEETMEEDIELTEFLKQSSVMYQGVPLTPLDIERLNLVLEGLFLEAREKKNKKKQRETEKKKPEE